MKQHELIPRDPTPRDLNGLWQAADTLADAGQLRRLSGAFARFIASLAPTSGPVALACILLSELEGRGHSCLTLDELAGDPAALLGCGADEWALLAAAAGPLPCQKKAWAAQLGAAEQVWREEEFDFNEPLVFDGERLYLRRYWRSEKLVAEAVRERAGRALPVDHERVRATLELLFGAGQRAGEDTDWQRVACAVALRARLSIITGGPGTGKTYTVARLLALLMSLAPTDGQPRIALAAPTGKAAARLKQSIDKALDDLANKLEGRLPLRELAEHMGAARTLHSLLGARPDTRLPAHDRHHPLDVDVLIVDEASMVHLEMMAAVLDALPSHATLILLGDKDQLASVEAGAVLGDLCHGAEEGRYTQDSADYVRQASGQDLPSSMLSGGKLLAQQTVMLRHSRRFGGPIGKLALAVNDGDVDGAEAVLRSGAEPVRWIERASLHQLVQLAVDGYADCLRLVQAGAGQEPGGQEDALHDVSDRPRQTGLPSASSPPQGTASGALKPGGGGSHEAWVRKVLQAFDTFRVLCAVRDGEWGVQGLNDTVEAGLDALGLIRRAGEWYVGRPVMVTRNDYGLGVFNGDIGLTLPDPARAGSLRVYFLEGEQVRSVLASRLREVETAFAMTVHKSQGSEFSHTVMVLPPKGRQGILARELVYTGITRARERFTLVSSSPTVLADAIRRRTRRTSGLRHRL
jgi:exodeoxyribonuclease V alpha subunit